MDIKTGKLPPLTSRDTEHAHTSGLNNIARSGTVAKRSSDPVPVHGGMHHVGPNGEFNAGISATAAAAALAGDKLPTDPPTIGKRLSPPAISPGMRSRTSPGLNDDAHRELGARVLAEAKGSRP